MTDTDMFQDYKGKIKVLKKKLRMYKNTSNDLEVIIESHKKEIDTLKQIISIQELQMDTPHKTRTDKVYQLKSILKKCRERGKYDLALKLINKYQINQETLSEKYYDDCGNREEDSTYEGSG